MDEYIELKTVLEHAEYDNNYRLIIPMEAIKAVPAADVAPVRYGRWVQQPLNGTHIWRCSKCETIGSPQWNYCPKCGARMDGGAK